MMIDHKNGNGLDNRRSNLRFCTNAQNQHNQRKWGSRSGKPLSSRYKGVSWHRRGHWRAKIQAQGKRRYLGQFQSEEAAARAYDRAARELHGEFAVLNFSD